MNVEKKFVFSGQHIFDINHLKDDLSENGKENREQHEKKEQKATEQTTTTATINKTHEANVIINNKL